VSVTFQYVRHLEKCPCIATWNYDSYTNDITYQWESIKRKTVCLVLVTFKGRGMNRPWHILWLWMTETKHVLYPIFQVTYSSKFLLPFIVITFVTSALISFSPFPYSFLNFIALLIFSHILLKGNNTENTNPDPLYTIHCFPWSRRACSHVMVQNLNFAITYNVEWCIYGIKCASAVRDWGYLCRLWDQKSNWL